MKKKKKISIRLFTQIVFFVLIGLIAINHGLAESGISIPLLSSASLHSLCPYGGVETFVSLVTAGTIVKKVHESAVVLMVLVLILTILLGPVFCGWVCPLGSISEWVGKIGRKIFKNKYNNFIPLHIDKYLRLLRYITLIWTVYLTTKSLKLVFVEIDPYYALFKFWSEEAAIGGIIVLLMTLILSLFIERPWCKYVCPYGALLGLFNKIRIFKIKRNASTCINCGKCDNVCPMNVKVTQQEVVNSTQCISCLKCTSENTCPVENTLELKMKSFYIPIIIIFIFTVGIIVSKQLGVWKTESSKVPKKIENGEFAGVYDPSDIRGSYTLGDIENSFDIKAKTIAKAFGIEINNPKEFQVKELEGIYSNSEVEIGTGSVRKFVALYVGIPYESDEALTIKGIEILYDENKISEEEKQELLKSAVEIADYHSNNSIENTNNNDISEEKIEPLINGNTTVQDAIGYGIELEEIEELVGIDIEDKSQTIRQICKDNSIPFSDIKNKLNEYIK